MFMYRIVKGRVYILKRESTNIPCVGCAALVEYKTNRELCRELHPCSARDCWVEVVPMVKRIRHPYQYYRRGEGV